MKEFDRINRIFFLNLAFGQVGEQITQRLLLVTRLCFSTILQHTLIHSIIEKRLKVNLSVQRFVPASHPKRSKLIDNANMYAIQIKPFVVTFIWMKLD